jgi:hypothetical protein
MKAFLALAFAAAIFAQTPVRLQFQCTADDLDSVSQNCSDKEPCPVYLELSSIEVVGPKIFVTGNLHTERSTLASILLASDDGGHSWTEPHPRIRTAGLDQIQFIDFEVGWIAGQTISGRPRDPFFLLTTDGGKNWRQRFVFDESHSGLIEQFWFESRTAGALLIDRGTATENGARHEMCESMTGGESWAIREVSASPLRLKRFRESGNPDWRLRPDPKVFRVEHRVAGKWITLAVFPLRVGECKTIEPVFAEPVPADTDAGPESEKKPSPAPAPARKKKP